MEMQGFTLTVTISYADITLLINLKKYSISTLCKYYCSLVLLNAG